MTLVVICLKNRTFAVSQTSGRRGDYPQYQLWFAWKIVLLQYHKHLAVWRKQGYDSCDLLEKSYFCSITNIRNWKTLVVGRVVICLKNRTFAVSQTSVITCFFKSFSCDLLEKSYFCSITNINRGICVFRPKVVICLKNRTFAVSQTSLSPC